MTGVCIRYNEQFERALRKFTEAMQASQQKPKSVKHSSSKKVKVLA